MNLRNQAIDFLRTVERGDACDPYDFAQTVQALSDSPRLDDLAEEIFIGDRRFAVRRAVELAGRVVEESPHPDGGERAPVARVA